jgi:hypothetical protein
MNPLTLALAGNADIAKSAQAFGQQRDRNGVQSLAHCRASTSLSCGAALSLLRRILCIDAKGPRICGTTEKCGQLAPAYDNGFPFPRKSFESASIRQVPSMALAVV